MFTSYSLLILAAGIISSNCHPIDPKVVLPVTDGFGIVLLGTAFLITTVVALIACSCCKQRRDGFKPKVEEVIYEKEFQNPEVRDVGFSNALSSELAIFPPPGGSPPASSPQPPPVSPLSPPSKPAAFSAIIPSISDWFTDPNANFPRQQLFYQKEIGKGWFGKVVKGEGRGVKVVVRILREDATPEEKGYFLHEARPFRDLRHKNIARLFGRCLENDPFLLLFHFSANGDLKSFLVTNSGSRNAITEQKISLKMMLDVTEGLKFMNENGYIHTDLAARNCLVSSDLTVKIGDYGTSIDKYKNEYYIVGDMAVPIRWCAPETLTVTSTTIQTNQVTEAGNVWSLGVLLWEIAEFGKLPYSDLSDEQVIIQVFGEGKLRLSQPNCSFGQYLHHIMASCWKIEERATIEQVLSMLVYLKTNPFQDDDFEARWRMLKPNTIAVVDNHTPIHSPRHTLLAQRPQLPAKLEFDSGVDLEIKPTDENPDSCRTSTPITVSPQLSVASEEIFQPTQLRSPSLTNLKGSLEDVTQFDSWLTGVEQKTEEDRTFVKNISEAIKNLDETLALEKTSSSSADSSMEGAKKPLLEFRLGPQEGEKKGDSLSSDTEEETWRKRIERGEFSEKVKEKSKSVTDLMVLTHIESEGSESDSLPSLSRQCSVRKGGVTFTGVGFGSEGNIRNAVLSDELQEKLKQLALWKTDTDQSFLGIGASETIHTSKTKGSEVRKVYSDVIKKNDPSCKNSDVGSVNNLPVMKENILETVNTQSNGTPLGKKEDKICIEDNSTEESKILESNVCLDSSQSEDNSVPKIVITESELSNNEPLESESDLDAQYFVNIKPRKFVFVCRDLDDDSFVEPPLKNDPSPPGNDNSSSEIVISEPKLNCSPVKTDSNEKNNSSVILGPCNEHTLDYFKGLKTTFMPMNDMYSHDYVELNDVDLMCDMDSDITDNLDNKLIDKINDEDSPNYFSGNFNDYPLPDLVPENSNNSCKSSNFSSELENYQINDLIKKSVEQAVESKLHNDKNGTDEYSLLISSSAKDTSDDLTQTTEDEDGLFSNDEKHMFKKNNFTSDRTLNSNDSLSTDSPVAGTNILNSCSLNTSDSESSSSEDVNSSEEQLVEAPYPFNQPLIPEHHIKSKSLDSFLLPKNDLERINGLMNGVFYENNLNASKHFVPVFNMTESVSENAFINQNAGFDKYFSIDSGHSSDRCMEQDKQMNDLKNRLEDVVKSGSDFQLKNSEEEYGGKLLTPDDERSSDSGFRDKGSLSESVEDTCDEKYNLEDIDAELDDYTSKSINNDEFRYYEQLVNEKDIESNGWFLPVKPESSSKENGWISQSTENEESLSLSIDAEFAAAIRNELKEKLPCAQQNEKSDEDNSPEVEEQELNTDSANQFAYPSQLSPILEEQESNQSSLQLNDSSPTFILLPPDSATSFKDEIIETLETPTHAVFEASVGDNAMIFSDDKNMLDDDVLIVDTETNEATLIESPKPQSHASFILFQTEDQILFNGESPETYSENFVLTPENAPSTPNSIGTESHSSPENGNMSGFFLSPCSVRSDLFDSGPPSLPFDLGQSLEEVEDLPIHKVASLDNISQKELNFENGMQSPVLESSKCENKMQSAVLESKKFDNSENYSMDDSCEKTVVQEQEDSHTSKEFFNSCFIVNEEVQQKVFPTANYPEEKILNTDSVKKDFHLKNGIKDIKPFEQTFDDILSPESSDDSKYFSKSTEVKFSTKEFIERESQVSPNPSTSDSADKQLLNDEMMAASHFNDISEKKSSCLSRNHSEKDWSEIVPGKLGPTLTSTLALLSPGGEGEGLEGGPLPSPEDGWRPTISQLMELTEADGEEMTTSFIDPDPNGTYTPDWESDISESSSSGEFLWREGDKEDLIKCVASDTNSLLEEMGPIMERIEEEDEDCSSTDSESSSEGSASTEFRPSSWNAYARPLRPILRTPSHQGHNGMKRVVFKKEKYQCVYEYPREDSDSEEEPSWQTPATSLLDYSVFTDWELGEGEVPTPMESVDSDSDEAKHSNSQIEYDFYRLDYNPTSQSEWRESLPGSDTEFAPLAADLIPVRLGDLKHTKATLRLELPTLRPDQGEASILDSGSNTA